MQKSTVYILVYPELKAIKIGKADNVLNRIQQLCQWGKPDFEQSYVINTNMSDVYKLESSLHLYLSKFKKEMNGYKGYSEFFEFAALNEIPKLLTFYGFNSEKIALPSLSEIEKVRKLQKNKLIRFKNSIHRKLENINNTTNVFNNIKRCVYLMKIKSVNLEFKNEIIIIESSILLLINDKKFRLCGCSIVNMSGGDSVFIDIVRLVQLFNQHVSSFVREYGFDLSFFYSVLIDCYNFLKKGLPNESELPTIKINKENSLEIIF